MDIVNNLGVINDFLNQYYTFRAIKFLEAVILIIIFLNIVILSYIFFIKDRAFRFLVTGQNFPDVRNSLNKEWQKIKEKFLSGDFHRQAEAVVEAGTLVFQLFKTIKYEGSNLEEQLENIPDFHLSNLPELKKAARIRREILQAKQSGSTETAVTQKELFIAIKAFEQALAEQEAISPSVQINDDYQIS